MARAKGIKTIVENRKAYHEYEILDRLEAGLVLTGTEVKSLRAGQVNVRESYVRLRQGEAFLVGMHISPYEQGNRYNVDPLRDRKLLLHRRELNRLLGKIKQDGLTLVPTKLYFRDGRVKVEVGLARGKKLHDKRASAQAKTVKREMERALRSRNA